MCIDVLQAICSLLDNGKYISRRSGQDRFGNSLVAAVQRTSTAEREHPLKLKTALASGFVSLSSHTAIVQSFTTHHLGDVPEKNIIFFVFNSSGPSQSTYATKRVVRNDVRIAV